jgi:hypothetical protein
MPILTDAEVEEATRVRDRLRSLFFAELVGLPDGVTVNGVTDQDFTVTLPWSSTWLGSGHGEMGSTFGEQRYVLWGEAWSVDTKRAAVDPDESSEAEERLARLVVQDVAFAAAQAVIHEFIEFASVSGRRLWDAHPGLGASVTDRIAARFANEAERSPSTVGGCPGRRGIGSAWSSALSSWPLLVSEDSPS